MSRVRAPRVRPSVFNYEDYKEKTIIEWCEDSLLFQLMLMLAQIFLLFCKISISMVRDILDCFCILMHRVFIEDGEVMLALDYLLPFMYFMKTD